MAEAYAIEMTDLRKTYDGAPALQGLSLRVPPGCIFGVLGPNGAGKTTAIKVLLGMTRPSSGDARVLGWPATDREGSVAIRRHIGFVSEDKDLYDAMTVERLIRCTADFFPQWRLDLQQRYLRLFELPAGRTVKTLSRGMRTKLALLLALCRNAELLILDEPTSGLDPATTEQVLQALVSHVASEQVTVFFSSHQIAEVDQIADHVAIVHRGAASVSGDIEEIRQRYCRIHLVFEGEAPEPAFRTPGIVGLHREGRTLTVLSSVGPKPVLDDARALQPVSVDVTSVTLKEIFLATVAAED